MLEEKLQQRILMALEKKAELLDLSGMEIIELPAQIGLLTNLRQLDVGNNHLTSLPPEIGQLANLETLGLINNNLISLPPQIGQLTNLKQLDLSLNALRSLPAEIQQLINLTSFTLKNNQLTSLPSEIGQLTRLEAFDLTGNQITRLPPEIERLTSLHALVLHENRLPSLPREIAQLTNLKTLDLRGNLLPIPDGILGRISEPKTIIDYCRRHPEVFLPPEEWEEIKAQETELPEKEALPDRVPTHPDRPAEVDALGRKALADALAKRIRQVRHEDDKAGFRGPFRINMYGPWGSGKTSLLNFLQGGLQTNLRRTITDPAERERHQDFNLDPWIVVWFNAWEHQRVGPPWWSLMDAIYREGKKRLFKLNPLRWVWFWFAEFCWRGTRNWAPVLVALGLVSLVVAVGVFGGYTNPIFNWIRDALQSNMLMAYATAGMAVLSLFPVIMTIWGLLLGRGRWFFLGSAQAAERFQQLRANPTRILRGHFRQMLRHMHYPTVVFVDDLDRCDGNYVVQLLEGIQTVFGTAGVTYVVAADRRWIRESYQNAYMALANVVGEPGRPLGTLLLEKTFQLTVPIPCVSPQIQRDFWQKLIGIEPEKREAEVVKAHHQACAALQDLKTGTEIIEKVQEVAKTSTDPIYQQAIKDQAAIRFADTEIVAFTEHMLTPFGDLLDPNPRSMKRLVNYFGVQQTLLALTGGTISEHQLALWTILDMRWPRLGEFLEENPEFIDNINPAATSMPPEIPIELRPLFTDEEVYKVVQGEVDGVDVKLTQDVIEQCDKMRS